MRILGKTNIDFLGKRFLALGLSVVLISTGISFLVMNGGPALGIDFAGGSQVVVRFLEEPDVNVLRDALQTTGMESATIQEFRSNPFAEGSDEFIIRSPGIEEGNDIEAVVARVNDAMQRLYGDAEAGIDLNTAARGDLMSLLMRSNPLAFDLEADLENAEDVYQAQIDTLFAAKSELGLFREWSQVEAAGLSPEVLEVVRGAGALGPYAIVSSGFVSAQVGQDLRSQTVQAIVWALVGMLAYISYRFEFIYGVGAVAALAHDVLIVLGAFAITGREFNLPVVAAFLTIVGYSLNDTVVVFDRIRENNTSLRRLSLRDRVNTSLNQTLSRTVLTSVTTLIVVLGLFIYGGPVINDFAFALLIGVLVGTYSSLFVATPLVYGWQERQLAKRH